jgi:hypothetical protein
MAQGRRWLSSGSAVHAARAGLARRYVGFVNLIIQLILKGLRRHPRAAWPPPEFPKHEQTQCGEQNYEQRDYESRRHESP